MVGVEAICLCDGGNRCFFHQAFESCIFSWGHLLHTGIFQPDFHCGKSFDLRGPGGRMAFYDVCHYFNGRLTAFMHRYFRNLFVKDLLGDEETACLYYKGKGRGRDRRKLREKTGRAMFALPVFSLKESLRCKIGEKC